MTTSEDIQGKLPMKKNIMSRGIEVLRKEGAKAFSKKTLAYLMKRAEFLFLPYALLKIKLLNRNCTLNELVDFAFNDLARVIKPFQVPSEISELLKIVDETKPKVILEIGTANGGTLFLFSRVASKDATIISIDLPGGKFGGGYPKWREFLYKSFALPGQKMHLLRADSHKKETLEQVKAILNCGEVDFLFIDGDHTYEGVKRDFEMYSPLVKQGGIIAFHDIVPGPNEAVGGVPQFWEEIRDRDRYNGKEIVEDWDQGGYGIGLLSLRGGDRSWITGPRWRSSCSTGTAGGIVRQTEARSKGGKEMLKVKDLSIDELEHLIEQKILEVLGDPDSGLGLKDEFKKKLRERLKKSSKRTTHAEVIKAVG